MLYNRYVLGYHAITFRNISGLGGVGGPYRLDAGHNVHQVSDEVKNQVPEHIRKAAREMNRKAYKDRLREIQMSEHDAAMYEQFSSQVTKMHFKDNSEIS